MKEPKYDRKIHKVAILVALACVLQIAETFIPHPIPGLRLGLANMLTLTAMVILGFGYALQISILRTILSAFIMGTFMSPTFILSLSGAIISTLLMGFFYWLSGFHKRYRLSIIGVSIIGAFSHNMVQLFLAYLILLKHQGIFMFFPWLSIGSVVTGWIIGVVAAGAIHRLQDLNKMTLVHMMQPEPHKLRFENYIPGESYLHRLSGEIKTIAVLILSFVVLIFGNFWLFLGLFSLLAGIAVSAHIPISFLLTKVKRYVSLILIAFFLPIFFNSGTHTLVSLAYFNITYEGLSTGALFASRILFLILASSLMMRTTSPEEMTQGLAKVLLPLDYVGVSGKRIATILSLAWSAIPSLWETVRRTMHEANVNGVKHVTKLIPILSNLIAALYMETESDNSPWRRSGPRSETCPVLKDRT